MQLFDDIKSPLLLKLKGGLFGLLAIMAGTLAVSTDNHWYEIGLLIVCVWASCRFYYFLFYVLDHYVEHRVGDDKNAGVFAMIRKLCGKQRTIHPPVSSTPPIGNLFADLPESSPDELIEDIIATKNIRIERIVSTGQASPSDFWYDQAEHEWVVVLRGEATLEFEGETEPRRLSPGDYVRIPAHCKHRVTWTSPEEPTVWLAVFFKETDCD